MAKFTLTIDTDKAAFADNGLAPELVHVLRDAAARIERVGIDLSDPRPTRDSNGNTVGEFVLTQPAAFIVRWETLSGSKKSRKFTDGEAAENFRYKTERSLSTQWADIDSI